MQPSPSCPGPSGPFQDPGERPDQELWGSYEPMGDVCSYVCVHLCVFICLPVYVFIYVSVCFYVCMCVEHMSVSAVVCVCMCPCACVGASFGVALRGGGLPVHGYLP